MDAQIREMISNTAFRAVLKNGHTMVAYISRGDRNKLVGNLSSGDDVRVRMSPFDMTRGEVVLEQDI